jgi:hypothetical protein
MRTNLRLKIKRINPDFTLLAVFLLIDVILAYPILRPDGIVYSTSYYYPLEPVHYLYNFLSSSWDHALFGRPILSELVNLPYLALIASLSSMLGSQIASSIVPFLAWYLIGVASYFFLRKFIRVGVMASFFGALFMSYNPWVLHGLLGSFDVSQLLSYSGVPLFLFASARFLELKKLIYVVSTGLIWTTFLFYPSSMIAALLAVVLYAIILIVWKARTERAKTQTVICNTLTRLFFLSLIVMVASSLWLIPTVAGIYDPSATFGELMVIRNKNSLLNYCEYNSRNLKFPGSLLGLTDNRFWAGFPNGYLIAGVVITVFALLSILLYRRKFTMYYFFILYLVSVFLMKGTNKPFSNFYTWILLNIPFAGIIRNPIHFHVLTALSISTLLAFSLDRFVILSIAHRLRRKEKHKKVLPFMLIILLIMSSALLVFNPQIFNSLESVGSRRIPNYYLDAAHFLENELQSDTFRVHFPGTILAVNYNWSNSPIEVPPLAHNLPSFVGLGITSTGMKDTEPGIVGYYLFSEGPLALLQVQPLGRSEIMGILNIKYVVALNDAIKGPYSNPILDLQITKNMSNLVLEKEIGSISLYRNLRYKPVVYIPKNIVIMQVNNAHELVNSAMEVENFNISDAVYLDKETFRALNFENASLIKFREEFKNRAGYTMDVYEINQMAASANRVNIKRISYDRYQVRVYNASDPLFLVLSDSYSPLWTLNIQNHSQKNIEVKHFKANLYANGWLISGVSGTLTINLEYSGRKYFDLSLSVFSVYFIVSTSYLLLYVIRYNSNFANRIIKNKRKS